MYDWISDVSGCPAGREETASDLCLGRALWLRFFSGVALLPHTQHALPTLPRYATLQQGLPKAPDGESHAGTRL
jgi:hypothetical protein